MFRLYISDLCRPWTLVEGIAHHYTHRPWRFSLNINPPTSATTSRTISFFLEPQDIIVFEELLMYHDAKTDLLLTIN